MEIKYYQCEVCGQIIQKVEDTGVPLICCGEEMQEMQPGTVDASVEKHVPSYKVEGNKVVVQIGAMPHPMEAQHYIQWVALQTKEGYQVKELRPGQEPIVCFTLCNGDMVEHIAAYCNIHSLWII